MCSNMVEVCRTMTGIEAAVKQVGGQTRLAQLLGVKQQAVSAWCARGYAPNKHVPAIRDLTGMAAETLMRPEIVEMIRDAA